MNVQLTPAAPGDKPILGNLLELYQHDLSEFDQRELGSDGRYGYKYLDSYWIDPNRHAFFIHVDQQLAGFVLINDHLPIPEAGPARSIAEFFILRKYRRHGIGRIAAQRVFDQLPGHWQVAQEETNLPAQKFWEKLISEYTHGDYRKQIVHTEQWQGPVLLFEIEERR